MTSSSAAVALETFSITDASELSFEKGDLIEVMKIGCVSGINKPWRDFTFDSAACGVVVDT
jgi:hypothetical protein